MSDPILAKLDRCRVMLTECATAKEAKQIADIAEAARVYAKRAGMSLDVSNKAAEYKIRAERRLGEILKETPKQAGARGTGKKVALSESRPLLKESGIGWDLSSRAQILAGIPAAKFEQQIAEVLGGKKHLSTKRVLTVAVRENKRADHAARVKKSATAPTAVKGPFGLVLADPPWRYEHCEADNREIENHYGTATLEEIFKHTPNVLPDSILFLWATAPKLDEALQVMRAWGFSYRSCAVWDKERIGMGYWWRIQHELLLVGVKGKPGATPEPARVGSIFREARGKHSAKPACVYDWIERAFPDTAKLEMYCRTPRKGWAAWGNEV